MQKRICSLCAKHFGDKEGLPGMTHGYCPECQKAMFDIIKHKDRFMRFYFRSGDTIVSLKEIDAKYLGRCDMFPHFRELLPSQNSELARLANNHQLF